MRRTQIILKAEEGWDNGRIAQELSLNRETVQRWRGRWHGLGKKLRLEQEQEKKAPPLKDRIREILGNLPRPGTPPTFKSEQVVRIGCDLYLIKRVGSKVQRGIHTDPREPKIAAIYLKS